MYIRGGASVRQGRSIHGRRILCGKLKVCDEVGLGFVANLVWLHTYVMRWASKSGCC